MSMVSMIDPLISRKLDIKYESFNNEDSFSFNVLSEYYGIRLSKNISTLIDIHFYAACHHKSIKTKNISINNFHKNLMDKHINALIKEVNRIDPKWKPHPNWLDLAYKDPFYAPFTYHKYDILV